MSDPWKGAARAMPSDAFATAARLIGCDEAAIRAVFAVESARGAYRADGSVERRFEPHHFPRARWGEIGFDPGEAAPWRAAFRIKTSQREAMFARAFHLDPEAALRAASWGAPQIMGFNARAAGHDSATEMVRAMADDEAAGLAAFVALVTTWGLDAAIRAHDWTTFEVRYNGGGQGGAYARKIEAEFRRLSGRRSPEVLRIGSRGASVREVQRALALVEDGAFGPETDRAVRAFQVSRGLPEDGIVGARTWAALRSEQPAVAPAAQPTRADKVTDALIDWGVKGGGAAAVVAAFREQAPPEVVTFLFWAGAALAVAVAAALAARWVRRTA